LATIPHERVVNGRETRLNERAMNLIKAQQKSDGKPVETDPTPFLDFECQRTIFERIPYFQVLISSHALFKFKFWWGCLWKGVALFWRGPTLRLKFLA